MQNYKLILAYDGSRYQGWQGQGNTANTIEEKLRGVLERMCGQPVTLQGSGRTDAGVHARGQVASCQLETDRSCGQILAYLNQYLPEDIGVLEVSPAGPRFHARLSAQGKVYVYRIWNSPQPDVFGRKYRLHLPQPLDLAAMEQAAQDLLGEQDFRSFCGLTRFKKSTVRRLDAITITREGSQVSLRFQGNGFLNRMVRILSGTLVEVGLGLRAPDSMPAVLAARDRKAAAGALPPHGLMLEQVFY